MPERMPDTTDPLQELRDLEEAMRAESSGGIRYMDDWADLLASAVAALEKREAQASSLTFAQLSETNHERALVWHPKGLEEWTVSDWAVAMAGEAGEVCNAVKKLRRVECGTVGVKGPHTIDEATAEIATEIGDTAIYLDLLAKRLGLRLEDCVSDTFNRVSVREGFPHRLRALVAEKDPTG